MMNPADDRPRDRHSGLREAVSWLTVILAFSLPLYRPWVTLASILIMVLWWFSGNTASRFERLRRDRLTLAVLVFIAINLVSLVWSANPEAGLKYVTKYCYLLLIPMLATAVRAPFRRRATVVFEIAAALSVIVSVIVFSGALRWAGAHPGNPSPFMAHLDYSLLLALASLLALTVGLYVDQDIKLRLLWIGLSLFLIFGLVVNIGRSGQLAFAGGLLALLVHWSRTHSARQIALLVTAGAAILTILLILSPTFAGRIQIAREEFRATFVDGGYESNIGGRVAVLTVAGEIVRENPLLGTGVGDNIPALKNLLDTRYPELKPSIYWYRHFHNQYAQVATETGLLGLAALAWIFWELLRGRYRRREIGAAAIVLATVYLVGFLGEPFFRKQIPLIIFALFAGLISAARMDDEASDEGIVSED